MGTKEIIARSRKTDPKTSKDAGAKVAHTIRIKSAIMDILKSSPLSDREIFQVYSTMQKVMDYPRLREGEGDIRKRRSELVNLGLVTYSGYDSYMKDTKTYQRCWELVRSV
jgi:hypothetical protein